MPASVYSRAQLESWAGGLKAERYVWAMTHAGETFLVADIPQAARRGFCSYYANRIHGLTSILNGRAAVSPAPCSSAETAIRAAGAGRICLAPASLVAICMKGAAMRCCTGAIGRRAAA